MTGIEPALPAWEAGVLPMNYIREAIVKQIDYSKNKEKRQDPNLFFSSFAGAGLQYILDN